MGSLQVAYRLPTGSGVTISQPQPRAAALQDSDLYVEVDKLDSYTHILPELTRLFAKGAVQPELAQFLIAFTLTMVSLAAFPLLVFGLKKQPSLQLAPLPFLLSMKCLVNNLPWGQSLCLSVAAGWPNM